MDTHDSINTWLAQPHTQTWLQLAETHQIPDYVLATLPDPRLIDDPLHLATTLAPILTRWPTMDQYISAHRCTQCRQGAGEPCITNRTDVPWHAARQTAGIRHRGADIGKAPWAEDRIPGRIYSDLTPGGKS